MSSLPINWLDREFRFLTDYLQCRDLHEIREAVVKNLHDLEQKNKPTYDATIGYYNRYKFWGEYHPESGVLDLADSRAQALWEHRLDFEWLYGRLCDYRSKKVLLNILSYWLTSESDYIADIMDRYYHPYFDYDLIQCSENEVFVDLGAYIGDTMADYVKMFGADGFKKYYCYEIVPESVYYIHQNVERFNLKNVVVNHKGASDRSGILYLNGNDVASTRTLAQSGEAAIPAVAIDEDIDEPVTFIKMDIEGMEEQALMGCRGKIRENHPKLALSVYHNHKDLWKLARMVDEIDPNYRFYLRYYGNPLLPTEYLLYAL